MLTMYDEDATVFTAMQAGARGYLLKGAEQDEIADAIRAVVRGQAIFGAAIASRMLEHFANPPAPAAADDPFPELTAAGEGDPRAARPGPAHRRDRLDAAPLAQDGEQQPHHDLRQARGRRPDRGGDPGPRARPGRLAAVDTVRPGRRGRRRVHGAARCRAPAAATGGSLSATLLVLAGAPPGAGRRCCWRRGTTTPGRARRAARGDGARPGRAAHLPAAPLAAPGRLRRPGGHPRVRRRRASRTPTPDVTGLMGLVQGCALLVAHLVADRGRVRTASAGRWCGCRSRSSLSGLVYFFAVFSAEGVASDTAARRPATAVFALVAPGDVRRRDPAGPRRRPRPRGADGRARRSPWSP